MAGVFPTHDDQACVWISSPTAESRPLLSAGADTAGGAGPRRSPRRRPSSVPGCAGPSGPPRSGASIELPNVVRQPYGPGWALVGDAGYHRDPITGHGITDAFRDAELLARRRRTLCLRGERRRERRRSAATRGGAQRGDRRRSSVSPRRWPPSPASPRFVELQKQLSRTPSSAEALALAGPAARWPHPRRTSSGGAAHALTDRRPQPVQQDQQLPIPCTERT